MQCCAQFKQSYTGPSPFSKIIAFDFYDGALQGLAQCSQCGACYRFDTVDWNFETGKRIGVLGALPRQGFEEFVEFARTAEQPEWPFWFPFLKAKAPDGYDARVNAVLSLAKLPEMAVASSGYCDQIYATRCIDQPTQAEFEQWVQRIGTNEWFKPFSIETDGIRDEGRSARIKRRTTNEDRIEETLAKEVSTYIKAAQQAGDIQSFTQASRLSDEQSMEHLRRICSELEYLLGNCLNRSERWNSNRWVDGVIAHSFDILLPHTFTI